MAAHYKCPKCKTQFSPEDPLLVPLILPTCRHSLCRGCLSSTNQCPVEHCHATISSKDKDRDGAPVNYTLLGKVIVENHTSATLCTRSVEMKAESEPVEITKVIDQCIPKTRSLLTNLEKMKMIQAEKKSYESQVKILSNHIAACHQELELTKDRLTSNLRHEKDRRLVKVKALDLTQTDQTFEKYNENFVEVVIDDKIFENIKSCVKIKLHESVEKKPEMMSSISVGNVIDVASNEESESSEEDIVTPTITGGSSDTPSCESATEADFEDENTEYSHHPIMFGDLEVVVVTMVESPSSFYVMRNADVVVAESFESDLALVQNTATAGDGLSEGQVVAVETRNIITRARIDSIDDEALVTYIDIGGAGHHSVSSLTALPRHLSAMPGLAHHCNLADISPVPPAIHWADEATKCFERVTQQTHCLMSVHSGGVLGSPLQVSLYLKPSQGVPRENKCCLAEFLVYKEMAVWHSEKGFLGTERRYQKGYMKLAPPRLGAEQCVVVVHVSSPGCLYIQLAGGKNGYDEIVKKLFQDLDSVYRVRSGDTGLAVLVPREGMACIAQYSGDSRYYRARVTSVNQGGKVTVQFVDFGSQENKEVSELRKIIDDFLSLPVMATAVSLAEIVPAQGVEWEEKAATTLTDLVRDKELTMFVEEEIIGDAHCKVFLYERLPEKDICINSWLVREGHALSLSGICMTTEYYKDLVEPIEQEVDESEAIHDTGIPGLCGDKNPEKVACRVINVLSPSSVYVRQVTDEEGYYQLTTDLQNYYSSKLATDVCTRSGSLCAVRLGGQEGWARAKVVRAKGIKVELKLLDLGKIVTLPVQNLRPLVNKFRFRNFVDEVHLADLVPAGSSGRWTRTACDKLEEILQEYEMMIFVEIVGKSLNGTVPVKMFVKELNGSDVEFVAVEEKLVEVGLAIPAVNRFMSTSSRRKVASKPLVDKKSSEKDQDLIKDPVMEPTPPVCWLPTSLPPSSKEFLAVATHVDWECNIYLLPEGFNQDTLRIVGNVLDSKFQGSSPRPVDRYWRMGERAIARWDLDGKWYRAKVIEVRNDMCTVEFVDYGTVEECKIEDMRKDLFMTEIPVQCFSLQLNSVRPVGEKWGQSTLDFLHSTIVDQTLHVMMNVTHSKDGVDEEDTVRKCVGSLTTRAGQDIGHLLVRQGYAYFCELNL